jgi:hypothetical protein
MGMADFYTFVVGTDTGKKAFYASNRERCECACTNGQSLCNAGGSLQCIDVRASNPNHCGACSRTCPAGTRCSGDRCVCEKDQCGNSCLDLRNHPRNCGRCGNVCASGLCYMGVCYDPPANPDRCYPREAFENGDFQRGDGSAWRVESATIAGRTSLGVFDGASSPDPWGMAADFPYGADHMVTLRQDVHVCAGQWYELNFKARRVSGDGTCQVYVTLGPRTIMSQNLGVSGATWNNFGPYRVSPLSLSEWGVFVGTRRYLTAQFAVTARCFGTRAKWSTIRMDSFTLAPV